MAISVDCEETVRKLGPKRLVLTIMTDPGALSSRASRFFASRHWRFYLGEQALRCFWHTALRLLSFLNFEGASVQKLFRHASPAEEDAPPAPPWGGSTLKAFLEAGGTRALERVDRWVAGIRFGDPLLCES
jgi:hypothetical protein